MNAFPPDPLAGQGGDNGSPLRGSGRLAAASLGRPGGGHMNELDLLTLARGPLLQVALALCAGGILLRLLETLGLGRKKDISAPRLNGPGSGWRTIFTRSVPAPGMLRRDPVTYVGGYVFHLGLFATVLLFAPHIALFESLIGVGWPALPSPLVDALALASLVALLVLLAHRLTQPVKRLLSGVGDYLAWALTFLPLLTGYLAYHHLLFEYTFMLTLHILSVELLIVMLPFTKLFHTVSLFVARWYNGDGFARKGVAS